MLSSRTFPADLKQQHPLLSPLSEASLPRHLSAAGSERDGSLAYVPKEKDKDNQLAAAIDLLHGHPARAQGEPLWTANID